MEGAAARPITRTCGPNVTGMTGTPVASVSPDGSKAIYICDWNLWVRDVATGQERQLTTDGEKNFGYATSNAGWTTSAGTALSWSPDSKKIATQQQDERKVGDMFLVETPVNGGHPVLRAWKYPLPGDPDVAMIHRVVIDVDTGKMTRLKMDPDFHRAHVGGQHRHGRVPVEPGRVAPRLRVHRSISQVVDRQGCRSRDR